MIPPPRPYVRPVYPTTRWPVRTRPLPPVNARRVRCPVCGAPKRKGCETPSLRMPLADHHLDRVAAARVDKATMDRRVAAKRVARAVA